MNNCFYWYKPDNILPERNQLCICYIDAYPYPGDIADAKDAIGIDKPMYWILRFDIDKSEWLMQDGDTWIPCMNNVIAWMPLECPFE